MEQWKKVKGYENDYEISNLAKIKSIKGKKHKIMKPRMHWTGYAVIGLRKMISGKSKIKFFRVHRLVAIAFIPNPQNLPEVDHIDGNRSNNDIGNLRWCTHSQNNQNRATQSNNKSGHTGVSWCKRSLRWVVRIKTDEKYKWIGSYNKKEDAIHARQEAEKKYFGDFRKK